MRRGQIEHPLNWILVLIAGAFFLLLFIAILRLLTDTNAGLNDVKTLGRVQSILDESQANPGTLGTHTLPEIHTRCELGSPFTIELSGQTREYPTYALFSPEKLKGETLLWSEEFSYPSPITTISYLIPKNTPILIIDGTIDVPQEIIDLLNSLNKKVIPAADLADYNTRGQDLIIVVSAENLAGRTINTEAQVHGIYLQPDSQRPTDMGEINFYTYKKQFITDGSAAYATKELLLAGLFAGNQERYLCSRSVIKERMLFLTQLESERISRIRDSPDVVWPNKCMIAYDQTIPLYAQLNNTLYTTDLEQTAQLSTIKSQLLIQHNALRKEGCPALR